MEDQIIRLEEKIAYQEKTLVDLDEVVCRLNRKVAHLEKQLADLRGHVSSMDTEHPTNERPPHYGGLGSAAKGG